MNIKLLIILVLSVCSKGQDDDFDDEGISIETEDPVYSSPEIPSNQKQSVYLAEHFDDLNKFHKTWTSSKNEKYDGEFKLEQSQKDSIPGDMGLVLKSKAKHAGISAKLDKPFVFKSNPLVIQYEVLFQDGQECGGAYLKLLTGNHELKQFHDKTPYSIMFGPDKCGNDHKLHFIFNHKNPLNGSLTEKHCKKPKERLDDYFKDKLPHLYTLVLQPDNSFEIWIDRKLINSGDLLEDFSPPVNPEQEIDDPLDQKPEDWDEREKIPDPSSSKPDDWDEDEPAQIQDPDAVKPDGWMDEEQPMIPDPSVVKPQDWDPDMDGEWEAPLIDNPLCAETGCGIWEPPLIANPLFKGKWRAPLVDNPNYKGKWRPRRIPNPDYFEDKHPFKMESIDAVGFELWSMSSDILFDNIIITDDVAVANQWSADTFEMKRKKIEHAAESVVQRILMYADEYPMLWIVYVIGVGLPIVLIVYCCCKTDKQEKEEEEEVRETYDAATTKKTDEYTKDDLDKPEEEPEPEEEAEEEEDAEAEAEEKEEEEEEVAGSSSGDVPRKRRVRKE